MKTAKAILLASALTSLGCAVWLADDFLADDLYLIISLLCGMGYLILARFPNPPRHAAPKISTGFCKKCGYDLRATPKRCPECGMVPKVARYLFDPKDWIIPRYRK